MKKIILKFLGLIQAPVDSFGVKIKTKEFNKPIFQTAMPNELTPEKWYEVNDAKLNICPDFTIWAKQFNVSGRYSKYNGQPNIDNIIKK